MTDSLIASVLHLDRKAVKALKVTDPYSLHRVVYSLYADVRSDLEKSTSHASGIVWADQGGDFSGRRILMLSNRSPAEKVQGLYGEVASKAVGSGFLNHASYRFNVLVNPTRRDSASGKLLPVKGREAIAAWFTERAAKSWGFTIMPEQLQVDRVRVLQFNSKAQHPVTLAQAQLQGALTVTDPARFRQSFAQGIGRGRAFGCGLLQIVPMMDNPFD